MTDIFGIEESTKFAKAVARSEGITVKQSEGASTPISDKRGNIHIGVPSIYNHDEYMGSLHQEISKQTKDMSFFHKVELEPDSLQAVAKDFIQAQRTEYHMHGEYEGRDRILSDSYSRTVQAAGGVPHIVDEMTKVNPTLAAMMFIGNEMRNEWQGYEHCECPDELEEEVRRLQFIDEEWLSLETEDDLRTLLHRVEHEPPPPPEEGDGEGDDGDGSDGSDGKGGGSGGGGEGDPGSTDDSSQDDNEAGEGDDGGSGQSGEDSSPESEDEEQQGEGEGSPEDTEDSEDGEGQSPESQRDPEVEGEDDDTGEEQRSDNPEGDDGDQQSAAGTPDNSVGAGQGGTMLENMGLTQKPIESTTELSAREPRTPYQPRSNDLEEFDVTKWQVNNCAYGEGIKKTLGTFTLSKKVKKYLISVSQIGYQYGMKRGKLCSKSVSRIYAGHNQPRIFKQRLTAKIEQDTALFMLGDVSGSMSNERYYTSASCQIAMSEVMQTLKIPHSMMQFSTGGRGRAHYIMKHFEERYVSRDKLIDRYGNGKIYMGCNADGEAVTAAAQVLARRPEKNKILIVLSDGNPAYGRGDDEQFLVDTVKSIEDSGLMHIIGVGIQTHNITHYYSESKVINELTELEGVLLGLLKKNILK